MKLGSDTQQVRRLASQFDGAGQSIQAAARRVQGASGVVTGRFGNDRSLALGLANDCLQQAARLRQSGVVALREATDQERVSADRPSFAGAGLAQVRTGAPLLLGVQARRARGVFGDPRAVQPHLQRLKYLGDGADVARSLQRSLVRFPHAPRKLQTFLNTNVRDIKTKFAPTAVKSPSVRKASRVDGGIGMLGLVGGAAATHLEKQGGTSSVRLFGGGSGKTLDALVAVRSQQSIWTAAKVTWSTPIKAIKPLVGATKAAARVGGGLAILGGAIGLIDTTSQYRAGNIKGRQAAFQAGTNVATMVGGALMFTPAAPIGVLIVAGAAVVQAGAWALENRKQIAAAASTTVKAIANSSPGRAAVKVAAVAARPAQAVGSAVTSFSKSVSRFVPKFGKKK